MDTLLKLKKIQHKTNEVNTISRLCYKTHATVDLNYFLNSHPQKDLSVSDFSLNLIHLSSVLGIVLSLYWQLRERCGQIKNYSSTSHTFWHLRNEPHVFYFSPISSSSPPFFTSCRHSASCQSTPETRPNTGYTTSDLISYSFNLSFMKFPGIGIDRG